MSMTHERRAGGTEEVTGARLQAMRTAEAHPTMPVHFPSIQFSQCLMLHVAGWGYSLCNSSQNVGIIFKLCMKYVCIMCHVNYVSRCYSV